jgi:prepilin-type N-terminal cleavage/methylation domain-containing protein
MMSQAGRRTGGSPGESGFTLIEMLIAMALMAILMVGVLPMFAKSMSNNVEGNQLTEVTNRARLRLEELMAMPITAEELEVPAGEIELVVTEMWSEQSQRWIEEDLFPADEEVVFTRSTRVRQFNMSAINNLDPEFDEIEALPGGAPTNQVHIKEILVRVNSGRPTLLSMLGRNKAITLRALKSV